jgi:nucleotide-binding universal stress UspA family protein
MTRPLPSIPVVLVAVDASPQSLTALETAAKVASRLNAELRGIYVEDIDLVRTAELPFARVITTSGQPQSLTPEMMQRQLDRQADIARNAVEAAGIRCNISWSFSVVRGAVYGEIARAASLADFVTVGRSGWSALLGKQLGSVSRSLLEAGTTSLLMVGEGGIRAPLAVVYDGSPSSDRALALAVALDGSNSNPIIVVVVGGPALERWKCVQVPARTEVIHADQQTLFEILQLSRAKTVLIPVNTFARWAESAVIVTRKNLTVFLLK